MVKADIRTQPARWAMALGLTLLSLTAPFATASTPEVQCRHIPAFIEGLKQAHIAASDDRLKEERLNSAYLASETHKLFLDQLDPRRLFLTQADVDQYLNQTPQALLDALGVGMGTAECKIYLDLLETFKQRVAEARDALPDTMADSAELALFRAVQEYHEQYLADGMSDAAVEFSKTWPQNTQDRYRKLVSVMASNYGSKLNSGGGSFAAGKFPQQMEAFALALRQMRRVLSEQNSRSTNEVGSLILRAMLSGVDAHSGYMDREEWAEMRTNMASQFSGIGVQIIERSVGAEIVKLTEGGPAERQGILHEGDVILEVDGQSVYGLELSDITDRMKGADRSQVVLNIYRDGSRQDVTVTRGLVSSADMFQSDVFDGPLGKIGYVRLGWFYKTAGADFCAQMAEFNRQGVQALVFDLRNNPGGLVSASNEILACLIGPRRISLQQKFIDTIFGGGANFRMMRTSFPAGVGDEAVFTKPVVTLVNSGSASASEIVAGALKVYRRGLIVGPTQTYGKGSVQTVGSLSGLIPLPFEVQIPGYVRITTAFYFTPDGQAVHGVGIEPDVYVFRQDVSTDRLERGRKYTMGTPESIASVLPEGGPSGAMILEVANFVQKSAKREPEIQSRQGAGEISDSEKEAALAAANDLLEWNLEADKQLVLTNAADQ